MAFPTTLYPANRSHHLSDVAFSICRCRLCNRPALKGPPVAAAAASSSWLYTNIPFRLNIFHDIIFSFIKNEVFFARAVKLQIPPPPSATTRTCSRTIRSRWVECVLLHRSQLVKRDVFCFFFFKNTSCTL